MIFTSPVFLYIFLPAVSALYFVLPKFLRTLFLFLASSLFYSWGEGGFLFIYIFFTLCNFLFALAIEKSKGFARKLLFITIIFIDVGFLVYYKYLVFLKYTFLSLFDPKNIANGPGAVYLPLAISFITF